MAAQPLETVVLPRVNGRHRDRALASARKCRAIQLKLQGLTYQQIADELGYTSRGTVYKIIKTAQATQLTGAVEEHLDIEVSRLNALQAVVWPAAVLAGMVGAGAALLHWKVAGFGALDPRQELRFVVPSVTAIAVGSQLVLGSLLISILQIRHTSTTPSASEVEGGDGPTVRDPNSRPHATDSAQA